jgi:hypothetical protein
MTDDAGWFDHTLLNDAAAAAREVWDAVEPVDGLEPVKPSGPVLTCVQGTNADLFPVALGMYAKPGDKIADVTYGRGVFWRNVPAGLYDLHRSDLETGVDLRRLPYEDDSFDGVVLDPPYLNGGGNAKESLNKCYRNAGNMCHENVVALYLGGILEARRVLKRGGLLFIKCQPAVADHKQKLTHVQIMTVLPMIGFLIEDEFILRQTVVPLMRHTTQQHARKNHSYLLVARWVR